MIMPADTAVSYSAGTQRREDPARPCRPSSRNRRSNHARLDVQTLEDKWLKPPKSWQFAVPAPPHITNYTPVNEPLTTARFSGLYGAWYPHSPGPRD